ncbi:MAG: dTMP kinase [Erythrobacter sp.]|nr:MAG: dTMP kinase [Erythrobacter sp.]
MSPGRFIAFEGGEGMGKSTQARLLADHLRKRGLGVGLTREPGGTPGAEAIRTLLLDPPADGWTLEAEALLFAAARADHVARLIRPALDAGNWVVCDRFIDSSRAYQGEAGALGDDPVMALHSLGSAGLLPDLTIVIDAPAQAVAGRLAQRDGGVSDAIGGRAADYHARVNAAFLAFARAEPDRFAVVDGSGSVEDVHRRILAEIATRFGDGAG